MVTKTSVEVEPHPLGQGKMILKASNFHDLHQSSDHSFGVFVEINFLLGISEDAARLST